MPKVSSTSNKSLFVKFSVKLILSTIILMIALSALSSLIILKLDIDLKYEQYFTYAICAITAFLTSYITLSDFKNNYLLVSVISVLPLTLFSFINGIVNKTAFYMILIKIAVELISAMLSAITKILRKRR